MSMKLQFAWVLLILGVPSVALSQQPDTPIDLSRALEIVRAVSVDVQDAELSVQVAERELRTRKLAWTPDLNARAALSGNVGRTFVSSEGANLTRPVASGDTSLVSSVRLWAGGERLADLRASRADIEFSEADLAQTRLDSSAAVIIALLRLGDAEARLTVSEADLATALDLEARITAFVDAGARTRADLAFQHAAVARSRTSVLAARQARIDAQLSLVELLRLDPAIDWVFTPPESAPSMVGDALSLTEKAIAQLPSMAAAQADIGATTARIGSALSGYLPTLDLRIGISTAWISSSSTDLGSQLAERANASAIFTLNVPIWDRGLTRESVERAEVSQRRAQLRMSALHERVAIEVRSLLASRQTALAGIEAAQLQHSAAAEALSIINERYDAGIASLFELSEARSVLIAAENELITARTGALAVDFDLALLSGQLPAKD